VPEELMEGVKTWLTSQAADFFDTGIDHDKKQAVVQCFGDGR
jgi:hypothetical protein